MSRTDSGHFTSLRLGGLLDLYLIRSFSRIFVMTLLWTTSLYFMVEFFDRIDNLFKAGASLGTTTRYFLFKVPLLISRVFGFATLFSTLLSLGMLSKNHEVTAMRSAGLSLYRISLPLLLVSLLIGLFTFFWDDGVVPLFTRKSQYIYKVEVKKKQPQSLIGTRGIWMRGKGTFISAEFFDVKKNILQGLLIYQLGQDFSLKGLIETPRARWNGRAWKIKSGRAWKFSQDGQVTEQKWTATALPISETPEDFKVFAREAEEFSVFELKRTIQEMETKGIDTTEYKVDLQVKFALPFISPLMVLLAIPFSLGQGPRGGIALALGLTMTIGFGYWAILAFCISLGHTGALQPWVAAWSPTLILAMVGGYFFTGKE